MKVFVVANTKGGSGKTNTAFNILPAVLDGCKIIEIDDNNNSSTLYKESKVVIDKKSITTKEAEEHLQDVIFDLMSGDSVDIVIDAGGGNDSLEVLKAIKALDLSAYAEEIIYIIPVMNSLLQLNNAKQMIDLLVRQKIVIALNGVYDMSNIENEWVFWYGSKELDIESFVAKLNKDIKTIKIPHSYLYELATLHKQLLRDFAEFAYEADQKEAGEILFQKYKDDKEGFKKAFSLYRRNAEAKALIESIKPEIQKVLGV